MDVDASWLLLAQQIERLEQTGRESHEVCLASCADLESHMHQIESTVTTNFQLLLLNQSLQSDSDTESSPAELEQRVTTIEEKLDKAMGYIFILQAQSPHGPPISLSEQPNSYCAGPGQPWVAKGKGKGRKKL